MAWHFRRVCTPTSTRLGHLRRSVLNAASCLGLGRTSLKTAFTPAGVRTTRRAFRRRTIREEVSAPTLQLLFSVSWCVLWMRYKCLGMNRLWRCQCYPAKAWPRWSSWLGTADHGFGCQSLLVLSSSRGSRNTVFPSKSCLNEMAMSKIFFAPLPAGYGNLRPAGSDPEVVCQKNSFLKVSVSLGGFGPSVAHGKHSVRRRCVQATKNKAETCSLFDAIGRRSCGRWTCWRDWV